ncbi:misacylated tRNA(Ala) deacylase [Salinibacter ruber]|uniref:Alanine--tRNA ligase n=1 Tax=Salinibacter ruber TaxID=146919 RepID=A0A9X2U0S1_9BACT|nr:alanyl-tRNA editing protein [Salinibacter ruber]MCS3631011.1 misacylated tRNA(Ala) deacylase [Salinibacter ruber]MCS3858935.1 misacylated tRNA(Ala) deacylase [Salinibacter ruber]MCS3865815.1 misacylated tRNA(Ala) deacylase [Salinibacter ruber]MCS4149547.1 misacylated tRNA(Ala) deacylase [Salinibacter ruber]
MTELRYLPDSDDVTTFTASVTDATDDYIVLDGTYFYPEGGGQPADHGTLHWDGGSAPVVDVQKEHGAVRHYIDDREGERPEQGDEATGQIDEARRRTLRRMHTAQHVLSKVVLDVFGAQTAGNQIHTDRSRIDFEPADFSEEDVAVIEERTNTAIEQDLPVEKKEMERARAEEQTPKGRGLLDLIPDHVDPLRMVQIGDLDLCPCGGTHVDRTRDIGRIRITNRTSKGAEVDRIEFKLED